jgi:hypothetical protein
MVKTRSYYKISEEKKGIQYIKKFGIAWEIVKNLDDGKYTIEQYTLNGKPSGKKFIRMEIEKFYSEQMIGDCVMENLLCEQLTSYVKQSGYFGNRRIWVNVSFYGDKNPIRIDLL